MKGEYYELTRASDLDRWKCSHCYNVVVPTERGHDGTLFCTECGGRIATPTVAGRLEDSGNRSEYKTGAVRDIQTGKGRFDLLSPYALRRLAIHYERGAEKYGDSNWQKGIPTSHCFSSAVRHLFRWLAGDRKEDHLAAALWNICAIMHFEEVLPEVIDTGEGEITGHYWK